MTITDAELARYAQAVIDDCLGTQPGDLVAVHGEPAHAPLARALVDAAYRAGARYVDLVYVDPAANRSRGPTANRSRRLPPRPGPRRLALRLPPYAAC